VQDAFFGAKGFIKPFQQNKAAAVVEEDCLPVIAPPDDVMCLTGKDKAIRVKCGEVFFERDCISITGKARR
jgi:hypothetical protein